MKKDTIIRRQKAPNLTPTLPILSEYVDGCGTVDDRDCSEVLEAQRLVFGVNSRKTHQVPLNFLSFPYIKVI